MGGRIYSYALEQPCVRHVCPFSLIMAFHPRPRLPPAPRVSLFSFNRKKYRRLALLHSEQCVSRLSSRSLSQRQRPVRRASCRHRRQRRRPSGGTRALSLSRMASSFVTESACCRLLLQYNMCADCVVQTIQVRRDERILVGVAQHRRGHQQDNSRHCLARNFRHPHLGLQWYADRPSSPFELAF